MLQPQDREVWAKVTLEKANTRQLLTYLDLARRFKGQYSPIDKNSPMYFTFDEIKAELAKRPHMPRGKEARKASQRAKQNR